MAYIDVVDHCTRQQQWPFRDGQTAIYGTLHMQLIIPVMHADLFLGIGFL